MLNICLVQSPGPNKTKYSEKKLTKYLQELYKKLENILKRYSPKWKAIPCSHTGKLNIVKMSDLYKLIHRFNTIPINFFGGTGV
jgi:hypothetical protein